MAARLGRNLGKGGEKYLEQQVDLISVSTDLFYTVLICILTPKRRLFDVPKIARIGRRVGEKFGKGGRKQMGLISVSTDLFSTIFICILTPK